MVFLIDSRITPESIGAVNKAGDVMTGLLSLESSWPNLRSKNTGENGRVADFYTAGMGGGIVSRNLTDGANTYRHLIVCPQDVADASGALQIFDVRNASTGDADIHSVLHTGNMSEMGLPKVTIVSNVSLTFENKMAVYFNSAITENSVCIVQERSAGSPYFNCVSGVVCQNGWATITHYNGGSGATFDIVIINT